MGYKVKAMKGVAWMGVLQFFVRSLAIIKIAFIARILTPTDLGQFGMTVLVLGLFEIFSEIGIYTFLIQHKEDIKKFINTIWILQIVRGIMLAVLLVIIAIPAAKYFSEPELVMLLVCVSLVPLLKGFENPYIVTFHKNLRFNKEFFYRFSIIFVDFLVSVLLAFFLQSVYALIIGLISSTFLGLIISWTAISERPMWKFVPEQAKKILTAMKWVSMNGILHYLVTQIDYFVIGRVMGASSFGLYQVAQKFSVTPMIEISDLFGKVTFPVYTKFSDDKARLKKAYFKIVLTLLSIEFIFMILFLFFSKEIILIVAGDQWLGAEKLLPILAVYGFAASVVGTIGALFLSVHRQDLLTKISLVRLIILAPVMYFFVKNFGLIGAPYALCLSLIIVIPLIFYFLRKIFNEIGV